MSQDAGLLVFISCEWLTVKGHSERKRKTIRIDYCEFKAMIAYFPNKHPFHRRKRNVNNQQVFEQQHEHKVQLLTLIMNTK